MSRTITQVKVTRDKDNVMLVATNILKTHDFHPFDYKGEQVFKKGMGLMSASKYIKVDFVENEETKDRIVTISGWIRSFGLTEDNLEGFVGVIPKESVKAAINALVAVLPADQE